MVHRIQNRNPGYSDFSDNGSAQSFNFSSTVSAPLTEGATALKLENEVSESISSDISYNNEAHIESEQNLETDLVNNHHSESIIDNNEESLTETKEEVSNGLENFNLEEETPELFNSDTRETSEEEFTSFENTENSQDEDDLEIPAFLRRQKN